MSFKITGRIIAALPERSGVSEKSGKEWRTREYVLETTDNYPKKIAFSVFGDKIEELGIYEGAFVDVSVDIESREYQGRWFTSVKAFKAEVHAPSPQAAPAPAPSPQWPGGDMPF